MSMEEALEVGITEDMFRIYDRDKSGFIDEEEFMQVSTGPEIYEGAWEGNKRHGWGTFTYRDGTTYYGQWEQGLRHGKGKLVFKDGTVCIGAWSEDRRHGRNKVVLIDGSRYIGEFAEDKRNGCGRLEIPNGSQYQGQFVDDLPNGDGKLYKAEEESSYSGQFQRGIRSGMGRAFYHKTGNRFVGQWEEDMPREGHSISSNGVVHKEYFTGTTVMRREVLPVEEQQRIAAEADHDAGIDPTLGPVDTGTFVTAASEEVPRYQVNVTKFVKNRGEMAEI